MLRVFLILCQYLVVVAADDLIVDGHARTAQLRQDAVGQLAESGAHVLDLALTLFGVFVHREDAQDDILVLYVRCLHELLEAFPVLCGVLGVDVGVGQFCLLELLVNILLGVLLALVGKLVVQLHTSVRRCISRYLYVVQVEAFLVCVDFLEQLHEFCNGVVLQLALAQVGLLDEELDVGNLLCFCHAAERVGGNAGLGALHSAAHQL